MQGKNIQLTDSHQIRSLEVDEFYKYLGMEEKNGVNNNVMKDRILPMNKENVDNQTQRKEQNHGH